MFALLLTPACASTPPKEIDATWKSESPTSTLPSFEQSAAPPEAPTVTTEPSSSSGSRAATTPQRLPSALGAEFAWMERSETVRDLQAFLGVEVDGVYGARTLVAHTAALEFVGQPIDHLPTRPPPARSTSTRSHDDVPGPVLARIQALWPEDQWSRALTVARCESNYRVDAANPTSSARGVFQLLAPWRRDPGTGREVWGWVYTPEGEKLSAAAGLGISEADATYTLDNITVAHRIWQSSGWSPWNASAHCWRGS